VGERNCNNEEGMPLNITSVTKNYKLFLNYLQSTVKIYNYTTFEKNMKTFEVRTVIVVYTMKLRRR
jgi:hypothetical protein